MGGFFPCYQRRGHMEYPLNEEAPSKRGNVIKKMNNILLDQDYLMIPCKGIKSYSFRSYKNTLGMGLFIQDMVKGQK
jgi:hypothetical protein